MIRWPWSLTLGLASLAGGLALVGPQPDDLREFASWAVRPIALPFAWAAHDAAARTGNSDEVFARAQQILALLPSWTDGHAVFASQFALDGNRLATSEPERGEAALQRLQIALAWLEGARANAGRREIELLEQMAFLPDVAVASEPALAPLLRPTGGAAAIADRYLAIAESLGASPSVRESRTFRAVGLARGLLDAGDRRGALAVLDAAIVRSADVRDHELATEWSARLDEIRRYLRGESVDLTAVRADARMQSLLPYLH